MNNPLQTFRDILTDKGLIPAEIMADGNLHRCPTQTKPHKQNGAYIAHVDTPATLWWCNWENGEQGTFCAEAKQTLSSAEISAWRERQHSIQRQREAEYTERHAEAAQLARQEWNSARRCDANHPYLCSKGITALEGIRQARDGFLLVPVMDAAHNLQSLQRIYPDGTKRFLVGGKVSGGQFIIQGQPEKPVAVCEGILDAMSLQLCGWKAVALCGAGNTGRLIQELQNLPGSLPPLIFAGDDDEAGREMCQQLETWVHKQGGVCVRLMLPDGCKDVNEAWVRVPEQLKDALNAAKHQLAPLQDDCETDACPSMAALSEDFLSYLGRCQQRGVLSSGLAELDELLGGGMFPGLYVLGAPSSLGKTTLLLQMADEMAASGRDVLFFSLEMSRWELLAKSLCRTAAPQTALCARQLLRGEIHSSQLKRLLEAYNRRSGERIFISVEHEALTPEILKEKALRGGAQGTQPRAGNPGARGEQLQPGSLHKRGVDGSV